LIFSTLFCATQIYDVRKSAQFSTLSGHTDIPTSLALSPTGAFLLSPSLSSQTLIHDVRPFSPSPTRVHRVLTGAPAGFEHTLLRGAWSKSPGDEGKRVAVGGADRMVCVWDVESGRVVYKLPGHKGTVTSVDWHPKEPISESRFLSCFLPSLSFPFRSPLLVVLRSPLVFLASALLFFVANTDAHRSSDRQQRRHDAPGRARGWARGVV
jgi:WD40 repeat protein